MIELIAIVRRNRAIATKEELARIGCAGYSQFPVFGRGRQGGLRDQGGEAGLHFLPKTLFDLLVDDERSAETIEAVIRANQTGEFGDGKIFVIEVDESIRISTGERERTTQDAGVTP